MLELEEFPLPEDLWEDLVPLLVLGVLLLVLEEVLEVLLLELPGPLPLPLPPPLLVPGEEALGETLEEEGQNGRLEEEHYERRRVRGEEREG